MQVAQERNTVLQGGEEPLKGRRQEGGPLSVVRRGQAVLGDQDGLASMVDAALSGARTHGLGESVDEAWVERTAARVVDTVQGSRSTWQVWHVRAEAQRRVRAADVPLERVEDLVEQLTQAALARSEAMTSALARTSARSGLSPLSSRLMTFIASPILS